MDVEILRMFERLVVVLGGVMSIYLGYRLFYVVKQKSDSEAKMKLGDLVDVGLKKAAPGVFFALFGAWVLATSLTAKVSTTSVVENAQLDMPNVEETIARMGELINSLPEERRKQLHDELVILQIQLTSSQTQFNRSFIGRQPTPDQLPGKANGLING